MNIPDQAVQAAAKAFYGTAWDDCSAEDLKYALDQMRATLEAAAPHMLAPLLKLADERDETYGAIRSHITTYELRQALDPYRSHA